MALKDMLETLEEEGARQCKEIMLQAEAQAERIVEEAKEEAEKIRQEEIQKIQAVIQVDKAKLINEARLAVKRDVIQAKEELIEQAFKEAGKKLDELKNSQDYPKALERLIEEVLAEISDKKIIVSVEKGDEKIAKEILDRKGVNYELGGNLNSSVGLKVVSENGRISLTNTFDIRLKKAKRLLKSDIMNILFS